MGVNKWVYGISLKVQKTHSQNTTQPWDDNDSDSVDSGASEDEQERRVML